jgi:hypothetical protein
MVTEKINDVEDIFKYLSKKDIVSYENGVCKSPINYNNNIGYTVITNYGKTASLDLIVEDERVDLLDLVTGLEISEKQKFLEGLVNQDEKFCQGLIGIVGEFVKPCSMVG